MSEVDSMEESAPAKDPVLNLRRDHTYLQMLAEGFHRLAEALRSGRAPPKERVAEAVSLHRMFVLETHLKKERLLDAALAKVEGAPLRAALADFEREYARGAEAAATFDRALERLGHEGGSAAKELADALDHEADHWMRLLQQKEETIYPKVSELLSHAAVEELGQEMRAVQKASAALEERLTSWTSVGGSASD